MWGWIITAAVTGWLVWLNMRDAGGRRAEEARSFELVRAPVRRARDDHASRRST